MAAPIANARPAPSSAMAVLVSSGLDSAILLAEYLGDGASAVHPLYVRCGLRWEEQELGQLQRLLSAMATPRLMALRILDMPVDDLYREHWSISGPGVPGGLTRDEAVFLPGRNFLLLSKAMLWCHLNGVPAVAIATLGGNPFPDATPDFLAGLEQAVNQAVGGSVRVHSPYANLKKPEVLLRGRGVPLELTMSCLSPVDGVHCGACNKCAERRRAFTTAGLTDPTEYASVEPEANRLGS